MNEYHLFNIRLAAEAETAAQDARKQALLEAALLASQLADKLTELADSGVHSYPPGKPVIDLGQDSENSSAEKTTTYIWREGESWIL